MFQILRAKKLTTIGAISSSASHTYRERLTPNADAQRSSTNTVIGAGSSVALLSEINGLIEHARKRVDSALCIEYLITASPEFFRASSSADQEKFWDLSLQWLYERHERQNVASVVIHRDETTDHMVAYVVPISIKPAHVVKRNVPGFGGTRRTVEIGRPEQRWLSAKTYLGGREKLSEMQSAFHLHVSSIFGLERGAMGSVAKHETLKHFYTTLSPRIRMGEDRLKQIELADIESDAREAALKARLAIAKSREAEIDARAHDLLEWAKRLKMRSDKIVDAVATLPLALQAQFAKHFLRDSPSSRSDVSAESLALPHQTVNVAAGCSLPTASPK